jgi:signal transduction histidine kinase
VAAIAGGAALVVVITTVLLRGDPQGLLDARLIGLVLWVAVAVTVGSAIRLRRSMVGEAHARLREREQRLAEEERLRIAREVHDVVAHSLAMINVQAGTAAHVADRRPEAAKDALLAIKEASRTALTDLRATLDVLRSGGERAPTPGLARLPDLVTNAAAAGVRVEVTGQAGAGPLPAPVDLAAYRILQESLTNVVRHAEGADTVAVTFHRDAGALVLTVRDNGRTGPARPTRGNGLRGMAERAGALGGEVEAGPVPGGGFEVSARLPMPGRMDEPGTPADTERGVR